MKETLSKYAKLITCMFCIWLLFWVITPILVEYSPLHQEFASVQDKHDIPIGALYYTDLPFIANTIIEFQDTWKFQH